MAETTALDDLAKKLPEYLAWHNVKLSAKNMAICPVHHDTDASFHVQDNVWYCFGCRRGGNIFALAALLEGLPAVGEEHFSTHTVPTLADRFDVPYEPVVPKGVPPVEHHIREIYRHVHKNLNQRNFKGELKARGYTLKFAVDQGIGGIAKYTEMINYLVKTWGKETVAKSGLFNRELFDSHRLLFTIMDHYGRPCGFTGRATAKTPPPAGETDVVKYINTYNNVVFKKGKMFYNMHVAKRYPVVYLMEGTTDVLTAVKLGLPNSVAVLSNNITVEQVNVLRSFTKVVIALDGDEGGTGKIINLLKALPNAVALHIPAAKDPDAYLNEHGLDAFFKLDELEARGWHLTNKKYNNVGDVKEAARVAANSNPLYRALFAEIIATRSKTKLQTVIDAVKHEDQLIQRYRLSKIAKAIETKPINLKLEVGL